MILAICDLETTGFSREHHDIIELACVLWDTVSDKVIDTFHEYIRPSARIPALITEITGITNSQVSDARKSWDVLPDFYTWLQANNVDSFVGHNFDTFDSKFLEAQLARYNLVSKFRTLRFDYPIIDTMKIARQLNKSGKISTENAKQPTLAAYFDIKYKAHSAIEDVLCLLEIYKRFRRLDLNLK